MATVTDPIMEQLETDATRQGEALLRRDLDGIEVAALAYVSGFYAALFLSVHAPDTAGNAYQRLDRNPSDDAIEFAPDYDLHRWVQRWREVTDAHK